MPTALTALTPLILAVCLTTAEIPVQRPDGLEDCVAPHVLALGYVVQNLGRGISFSDVILDWEYPPSRYHYLAIAVEPTPPGQRDRKIEIVLIGPQCCLHYSFPASVLTQWTPNVAFIPIRRNLDEQPPLSNNWVDVPAYAAVYDPAEPEPDRLLWSGAILPSPAGGQLPPRRRRAVRKD